METPPCKQDPRGTGFSCIVSPSETKMSTKKTSMSTPPQSSIPNEICGKMISISPVPDRFVNPSLRLSPSRVPPLPCTGGFRLQPRKNNSYLTSHPPTTTPNSVTPSRGRKRGANETSSIGMKSVPRRYNENDVLDSPILMHHAMQSMSIRSPIPSTPSLQDSTRQNKESPSPLLVFSPSLKPSPHRQHLRCESLSSVESCTKPSSSVVTDSSRVAPMYGSPMRKARGSNSISNEHPSTPRSYCHASDSFQDPSTPASVRTLPSPHETPLPRSIKLTPRSRRQRDDSSESSMFLSPKEALDQTPVGRKEGTPIFSFEGGLGCLESSRRSVEMKVSPYVPVSFPSSRSTTSRTTQAVSSLVKESGGGSLRIETRSLLEAQDCTSTLDYIIASNARIAAQNCDDSLSDDSDGLFVLANPTVLVEERNSMAMPPPRPHRRRRMSPDPDSISFDASANFTDSELSSDTNPASTVGTRSPSNHSASNYGDKRMSHGIDFAHMQSDNKVKSTNTRYVHKYSSRLEPIESCCSLVGLGLTESSCIMDSNPEPATPPPVLDSLIDSTPPGTPSKASVRISRSDADNVHLTIANMAVLHQEHSPSLTVCSG